MDSGTFAQWAAVAMALVALVISAVNRRAERIGKVEERLEGYDLRLQKAEGELAHLPGKDSVHKLELAMANLHGQMAVVIERVGPIKAIADRLQEVMLEGARR